ncbi:MAG: DUF5110 domain-containing protein [Muribaculaceae bacterium]|nr:DUF5110 domain-containing protein [Muribaculaceae bacterium]
MKLYKPVVFLAIALLAIPCFAIQRQAQVFKSISMTDEARQQAITVTAIEHDILRVDVVPIGASKSDLPSLVKDRPNALVPDVEILKGRDTEVMNTMTGLRVLLDKQSKSLTVISGGSYVLTDLCNRDDGIRLYHQAGQSFYGAGERGYSFNLCGDTLINYNKQNYGYVSGEARIKQMGITMPFVISSKGYGIFFDDFCKSSLYLGETGIEYKTTSPQPVSYYIIGGQGRVENVVKNFTWLVGRQDLPPLWTLGYITSKYGYHDQRESEGVVDTLKREGYPLDGMVFDLYWYGKEQDMGRLEWDKTQWPDHRAMLRNFKKKGVNVVTISQPYVLTNGRAIDNYRELDPKGMFCKTDGTDTTQTVTIWVGQGGMFDVSNPDTRLWLRNRYKTLTDEGVTGWWGDLGEPEVHPLEIRHYNGLTAEQYHNFYGNEWSRIIYEMFQEEYPDRRPMIMMRAGTAGLQRYSVFPWSTDVSRSWGGFRPQVTIMLNAGLSGLGYMSHDVGGFALDPDKKRDGELYIRWLQLGLFSPMLRTHSQDIAEPYNYKEYGDLTQRIIRQRYNWLPYNYNLAYENTTQGLPLVRPLGFYESDNNIARYEAVTDQYLWGRDVMVAPVMQQGAVSRDITFPEGTWVDYNHPTRRYEGHTTVSYDAPIEVLPLFVRAGAFIPQATNKMENVGDYNPDNLEIRYYASNQPSEYTLFEDDMHSTETLGNGNHRLIHFCATPQAGSCVITIRGEGTFPGASPKKNYRLTLPGITTMPKQVKVNGKKAGKVTLDKQRGMLVIPVSIPNINNATTVEIIQ